MPILETKKQTDLEKRLNQLRRQVYTGREGKTYSFKNSLNVETTDNSLSDISFLRQDLIKIAIFSFLALSVEIVLYIAVHHNLLRLSI